MPDLDREEVFVKTFVEKSRRERWLELLASPKKRGKILDRMNHAFDYRDELAEAVDLGFEELVVKLRGLGADKGKCYLIVDNEPDLDGTECDLEAGVRVGFDNEFATVLDCVPGKLAVVWMEASERQACWIFASGVRRDRLHRPILCALSSPRADEARQEPRPPKGLSLCFVSLP